MLVPAEITLRAQTVRGICNSLKSTFNLCREFKENNDQTDPGWSGLSGANVNANGTAIGTNLMPADVSNAIGEMVNFMAWWATHGPNIEKICDPSV